MTNLIFTRIKWHFNFGVFKKERKNHYCTAMPRTDFYTNVFPFYIVCVSLLNDFVCQYVVKYKALWRLAPHSDMSDIHLYASNSCWCIPCRTHARTRWLQDAGLSWGPRDKWHRPFPLLPQRWVDPLHLPELSDASHVQICLVLPDVSLDVSLVLVVVA